LETNLIWTKFRMTEISKETLIIFTKNQHGYSSFIQFVLSIRWKFGALAHGQIKSNYFNFKYTFSVEHDELIFERATMKINKKSTLINNIDQNIQKYFAIWSSNWKKNINMALSYNFIFSVDHPTDTNLELTSWNIVKRNLGYKSILLLLAFWLFLCSISNYGNLFSISGEISLFFCKELRNILTFNFKIFK
jgi:hypothetical protein